MEREDFTNEPRADEGAQYLRQWREEMSHILDLTSNRSLLSVLKRMQPSLQEELIMKGQTHFS